MQNLKQTNKHMLNKIELKASCCHRQGKTSNNSGNSSPGETPAMTISSQTKEMPR